jgi:DNA-directed RNA polymerase subunit RPC12/RpoP
LQGFIAEGLTVDGIASSAGVSVATVEKWLGRHNLETTRAAKQRAARAAVAEGDGVVVRECLHHGLTEFKQRGDTSAYRCLRCRAEAVARRRRKVKDILVAEAGGACAGCGYSRYVGALHFHHRDPAEKTFSLSHAGVTRSISAARAEAAKCVLLCANCHAEVEAGIASLP